MYKLFKRLFQSFPLADMDFALLRPDQPGQFSANRFCRVHPFQVAPVPSVLNGRRKDPVPWAVKAFVQVLPDEDPKIIKLIEGWNASNFKYIFKLF